MYAGGKQGGAAEVCLVVSAALMDSSQPEGSMHHYRKHFRPQAWVQ